VIVAHQLIVDVDPRAPHTLLVRHIPPALTSANRTNVAAGASFPRRTR
jgi:hypothetical protein